MNGFYFTIEVVCNRRILFGFILFEIQMYSLIILIVKSCLLLLGLKFHPLLFSRFGFLYSNCYNLYYHLILLPAAHTLQGRPGRFNSYKLYFR